MQSNYLDINVINLIKKIIIKVTLIQIMLNENSKWLLHSLFIGFTLLKIVIKF